MRYDYEDEPEEDLRACDHADCGEQGLYRAPKSPANLYDYHWFCLDHVREYNKSWNYCAGMNEEEIEREIRRATTWERETRSANLGPMAELRLRRAVYEGSGFYGFDKTAEQPKPRKIGPEGKALAVLGLREPTDIYTIKIRYRELVKRHHPDINSGDPHAEERLKKINQAFHVLKQAYDVKKAS
jgi:DnaJ-domain-containing protein 1